MKKNLNRSPLLCLALPAVLALLNACASPKTAQEDMTGVSIQSLNYSAREVALIGVEMPSKPSRGGGGDALNPYGAGGTICCFSVPSVWRPDFKVVVEYQFYPDKHYRRALVSLPPYPDGIVGDIWLIVHADESAEAVVSQYGPSRPEWPGKVKGYPVPSREYRLKLWEERLRGERAEAAIFEKALKKENLSASQRADMEKALALTRKMIMQMETNKP